jgi:hypothetical protein
LLTDDILELKDTVIAKGLADKVFWITNKSTNADVLRAIK